MQDIRDNCKVYTFPAMQGDGLNQDTMNEMRDDSKTIHGKGAANNDISNVPVDVLSVPTKVQDGSANNFQFDVSPMPIPNIYANDTTAPSTSAEMGSSYYISPMPPTPNTATEFTQTPSSFVKDRSTLAALYQSSRRSRRDSPMTSIAVAATSSQGFLPPPPLASASPKPEPTSADSIANNSASFNDNWSTSDSMSYFIQAPPLQNYDHTAPQAKIPQAVSTNESFLTPLVPAKQTVSVSQFEFTPNNTMDRRLLDLANESSANMCIEQFSKFTTRSRAEIDDGDGSIVDQGTALPPTKKQKADDLKMLKDCEQASDSSLTNVYNAMAYSNAEIVHLNDGVQDSIESIQPLTREMVARHEEQHEEVAAAKRDQDVIRRKVQRLLLIRHATRCKVALPSSETGADASHEHICPFSSHCAEAKRLASHIRKCRDTNCQYKWCLTTRDILCHYRSCRDRRCEICGPVRAMHRREEQK